jgi:diguanylate cyclase (GGDEF)-like protein
MSGIFKKYCSVFIHDWRNIMSENILLSKLEENLVLLNKMYDAIRLVDPISKRIIEYRGSERIETESICYDYWKTGKICDNCISTRACLNNKCYMKMELCGNHIMMVSSIPVEDVEKPIVVELLKNVTDSLMIGTGDYSEGCSFLNVIAEINDRIIKDESTGLYNKSYITERLPADIVRSTLTDLPLSILFMDIDDFKRINDTYGHVNGDKVIDKISDIISCYVSNDIDWAARYGGDEFIICLNNTNSNNAYKIAEEIRNDIANLSVPFENNRIQTTASIGIYTVQGELQNAEEIIALADRNMFKAKQCGKNISVGLNSCD